MDDARTAQNAADANDRPSADTPPDASLNEKATKDTPATKPENNKKSAKEDLRVPPDTLRPSIIQRVWTRVRRDTTSTDWLIVVLTTVIAGTSYLQWREIHSGGEDTHTLAQAAKTQAEKMGDMSDAANKIREAAQGMVIEEQRMANSSKRALDASNRQNKAVLEENTNASRLDQRAWVAELTIEMDAPEIGKTLQSRVVWRNTGKTFAKRAEPLCFMRFSPTLIQTEGDLTKNASEFEPQSIAVLVPNAESKTKLRSPQAVEDVDKTRIAGTWYTYIWGQITYDDIFERPHKTVFCSFRQGGIGDFIQCPFHNDAD